MTVRRPGRVQAAQRHAVAAAVQRHRRHAVAQVHGAADPGAGQVVVVAALRRADPAQLRVDRRAVVALVVVLGQDLPVGRRVVLVRAGDDQPAHLVRREQLVERAERVVERGGLARAVDEDQAVPLRDRQLDQAPLAGVEAGPALEAGGRAQVPVQAVGPGVVRADDHALAGRRAARQQFVAAVPAGVREGVQRRRPRPWSAGRCRRRPTRPAGRRGWRPGRCGRRTASRRRRSAAAPTRRRPGRCRRRDGSIRLWPNGLSDSASAAGSSGAGARRAQGVLTDHTVNARRSVSGVSSARFARESAPCQRAACGSIVAGASVGQVPAMSDHRRGRDASPPILSGSGSSPSTGPGSTSGSGPPRPAAATASAPP